MRLSPGADHHTQSRLAFIWFVVSGFCSLVYQVVWLRLAFAHFGVITPVLSVVVSVFMLGLSLGSWCAGRSVARLTRAFGCSAATLYGVTELAIGAGAFAVPFAFARGAAALLSLGESDSVAYLACSALVIACSILPFCFCMGTTFPLVTRYLAERGDQSGSGFSFLYLANVIGATLGVVITAVVLIEVSGFATTLMIAGLCNAAVGASALSAGRGGARASSLPANDEAPAQRAASATPRRYTFALLFVTGFVSMAMEVIWTRAFTPMLSTTIYAFAGLLAVYLVATFSGTSLYRRLRARGTSPTRPALLSWLCASSVLPVIAADPRYGSAPHWVLLSIFPLCAVLGALTPKLVDDYAAGDAAAVGTSYGVNIVGSVLGPLAAAYVLLPMASVKWLLIALAAPFFVFALAEIARSRARLPALLAVAASAAAMLLAGPSTTSFEDARFYRHAQIRRDHTATVVATEWERGKQLRVNGIGVAHSTALTKMMAHLPLAHHPRPKRVLVICLGIGATLRASASWGVDVTAVELVPSVRDVFPYFYPDAPALLRRPGVRVVVDDGRRFLQRDRTRYDVVTIDPPPPFEAAASSLLYSYEFYELLKTRMLPGAILQQWIPDGDGVAIEAAMRSLDRAFGHVAAFRSHEGWGLHFLASTAPIPEYGPEQLVARMPAAALADLAERIPRSLIAQTFAQTARLPINQAQLHGDANALMISDDRPINEYFLLRGLVHALHASAP